MRKYNNARYVIRYDALKHKDTRFLKSFKNGVVELTNDIEEAKKFKSEEWLRANYLFKLPEMKYPAKIVEVFYMGWEYV